MEPAARKGDATLHDGVITGGSDDVRIEGTPAAREGDEHVCPIHGHGVIGKLSRTIYINGRAAARKQDPCPCNPITAFDWAATPTDSDADGTKDTVEVWGSAVRMRNEGYLSLGPEIGGKNNLDVLYGNAKGHLSADSAGCIPGFGAELSVEAGALKWGLGNSLGLFFPDDKGRNPFLSSYLEGAWLHAGAGGEILIGDDGNRMGFIQRAGFFAEEAEVNYEWRGSSPVIVWPYWTIDTKIGVSGSVGDIPSWSEGLWGYYNKEERRFHFGGLVEVGLGLGLGINNVDVSIGLPYGGSEKVAPNRLVAGFDSVLFGD